MLIAEHDADIKAHPLPEGEAAYRSDRYVRIGQILFFAMPFIVGVPGLIIALIGKSMSDAMLHTGLAIAFSAFAFLFASAFFFIASNLTWDNNHDKNPQRWSKKRLAREAVRDIARTANKDAMGRAEHGIGDLLAELNKTTPLTTYKITPQGIEVTHP